MSDTIPLYFVAQQVSVLVITPQLADAAGNLTDDTPYDIKAAAIFDDMEFQGSRGAIEISSADATVENYQQTKDSFVLRLSALDKAGKVSPIMDIYGDEDRLKITGQATIPNGTAQKLFTVIGVIDSVVSPWRAGRNTSTIVIRPCGIKPTWV
jgi:hypothetical protein